SFFDTVLLIDPNLFEAQPVVAGNGRCVLFKNIQTDLWGTWVQCLAAPRRDACCVALAADIGVGGNVAKRGDPGLWWRDMHTRHAHQSIFIPVAKVVPRLQHARIEPVAGVARAVEGERLVEVRWREMNYRGRVYPL